jgi:hypothetical protein
VDDIRYLIVPERELKGRREEKGQKESGSNADKPFLIGGSFDPLQPQRMSETVGGFEKGKITGELLDEPFHQYSSTY